MGKGHILDILWERDIWERDIWERNHVEIYNLSLDVVDLLSMASSFDTHTFAHHA
jgi:hypothetical protein